MKSIKGKTLGDVSRLIAEGCLLALIAALVRTGVSASGVGAAGEETASPDNGLSLSEIGVLLVVCTGMVYMLLRTRKRSLAEYRTKRDNSKNQKPNLPTDVEWIVATCILLGVCFSTLMYPWVAALLGGSLLALSLMIHQKGA